MKNSRFRIPLTTEFRTAAAILSLSLMQTHGNAASAGLAEIGKAFPHLSQTTISFVLTTVGISIVPAMLLAGALAVKVGQKRLILIGFTMTLVFGLSSFFIRDFGLLLAARALTGFGTGLISPFQASSIPRHFQGYAAQRMFGLQSAGVSILGVFYGLAGGYLSSLRWNYGFLVYLVAFAGIALVTAWLPADRSRDLPAEPARHPFRLNRVLVYLTSMHSLFAICLFQYASGVAYLLVENNTGNASTAGTYVALFSLGAFSTSILFGRLHRRFGLSVLPWGYVLAAFGLLLIGLVPGLAAGYAGSLAIGSSLGVIMPTVSNHLTTVYRKSNPTLSVAIFMGAFFTVQLVSPYILQVISLLPGGGTEAGKFLYAGSGVALLAIVSSFTWKKYLLTEGSPAEGTAV